MGAPAPRPAPGSQCLSRGPPTMDRLASVHGLTCGAQERLGHGGLVPACAPQKGWLRAKVRANSAWRLEALLGHLTQHRFGLFTSCPPLAYSLLTLLPLCTLGVRSRKSLAWAGATGRVSAGLIGGPTLCWRGVLSMYRAHWLGRFCVC